MRYLLDTNTCIAALRHHALVLRRLAAVAPADCAISRITTDELYTGIEKCADVCRWR
jgi:predicted nucleic acid-binding protein